MHRYPLILIIACMITGVSCNRLLRKDYNVEKESPSKQYRVKFFDTVQDDGLFAWSFHEWGSIQLLKGSEEVYSYKWDYRDSLESTLAGRSESIEWMAENVLRIGQARSDRSDLDNLVVVNATEQAITHAQISLSKYETFHFVDLPGGQEISLRIDRGPSFVACSGTSELKNQFLLMLDKPQGTMLPTGATKFELTIKPHDLK